MANFVIEPSVLLPYLPVGTELDEWNGRCYVSLVGFLFADTRLVGIPIPWHRTFEEVNLRFYVRYNAGTSILPLWRRGVVFVKEIVPKAAITLVANTLYGEHYATHTMAHTFVETETSLTVEYRWRVQNQWNMLRAEASSTVQAIAEGSEEEFITEHYWGYTQRGKRQDHARDFSKDSSRTSAYEVRHPRWNVHTVQEFSMCCSVQELYGAAFVEALAAKPSSVFLADGSPVSVMPNGHLQVSIK